MSAYQVIYADPAWAYRDAKVRGGVGHQYPTLSVEKICALPVSMIAADDCALFLGRRGRCSPRRSR